MVQLVIENTVRQQMLERVERLQDYIAKYRGPSDKLGLKVVQEFGELIPSLLDAVDAQLVETLNRFTSLLREEGYLKDEIEVVIRGIKAGEELPPTSNEPGEII